MPDGRKRILSPFTERKTARRKVEKNMSVKRTQSLAETDRGSYYKEEWLEKF